MTVKDLINFLNQYPSNMEITETRYSDFGPMELDTWIVAKAIWRVGKNNQNYVLRDKTPWLMGVYESQIPKMSEEDKSKIIEVLHYQGN